MTLDKIIIISLFFAAECRSLEKDQYQSQIRIRRNEFNSYDDETFLKDTPAVNDDDEESESKPEVKPSILTTGLVVDTTEGTTVNLPCRVPNGVRKYLLAPSVIKINKIF